MNKTENEIIISFGKKKLESESYTDVAGAWQYRSQY